MDHIWSVACTESIIDKDSNNISLLNVLEQIGVDFPIPRSDLPPGRPVIPIQFEIVSLWVRSDAEPPTRALARILMLPPGGERSPTGEPFDLDLTEHERLRSRTRFSGFRADADGLHWFIVQKREADADWEDVARIPIEFSANYPQPTTSSS